MVIELDKNRTCSHQSYAIFCTDMRRTAMCLFCDPLAAWTLKQPCVCPVPHRGLFEKIFRLCLHLLFLQVADSSQIGEAHKEDI